MTDLSELSVLCWDNGLFPYGAMKLAERFGRVAYFTPYSAESFPVSRKALWGTGLPDVERCDDFFDAVDDADLICFFDVGSGDIQGYLRKHGYRVWGPGPAEVLELDRVRMKKLQKALKMPTPKTFMLKGMDALREHLQEEDNEDQFVKLSEFRGDMETYRHRNWWLTEPWLKHLDHRLGPMREHLTFVVERAIKDAVEVGYDGFCVDGHFPNTTVYGYEAKDVAYLGRVATRRELPVPLQSVNDDLAETLGELGCRSLVSSEVRVTEDGTPYLIDPTIRFPSPPSEGLMEVFSNWPEIMWAGGNGELVEPIPKAKFIAEVVLRSEWANDDFLALRFPEEHRHLVRLHGHCIMDGTDYVVSLGMDSIGAAVGLGDTMEEAMEQATEVAKSVEGHQVDFDEAGFNICEEQIERGIRHGVNWD